MTAITERLRRISQSILEIIFPSLRYSQYFYEELLEDLIDRNSIWLDMGCGHQILPDWRTESERLLIGRCSFVAGIDYDLFSLQLNEIIPDLVRGDLVTLPFLDHSFNLISCNMVLEHVERIEGLFQEIHRVLAPGGLFVFHTPNKIGYNTLAARILPEFTKPFLSKLLHGRHEEDLFATFYNCNSENQIQPLVSASGLIIKKLKYILSTPQFMVFPPLVVFELLYLRIISRAWLRKLRPNLLIVLEKPS